MRQGISLCEIYFSGPEHARLLGHSEENLILACTFLVLNNGLVESAPCTQYGNITSTLLPSHFKCYTVTYTPRENLSPFGITVTLFLDSMLVNILEPYVGMGENEKSGIQVYAHPRDTSPNVWQGFQAKPGHMTTAIPNFMVRERLQEPYGLCVESKEASGEIWNYDRKLSYSKMGCFDSCVQDAFIKHCGCISPGFQTVGHNSLLNRTANITGCTSMKHGLERFKNMSACTYSTGTKVILDCFAMDSCKDECQDVWLTMQVDSVPWPLKSQQLSFYKKMIKHRHFAPKFDIYEEILDEINRGNKTKATSLLQQQNLIENNFVKFTFNPAAFHIIKLSDIPKTQLVDLFSSLGGTLNLYSGITLLVVVEIIELLWKLLTGSFQQGSHQTRPTNDGWSMEKK